MRKRNIIHFLIRQSTAVILTLLLAACSGFFDKDNTKPPMPLPRFIKTVQLKRLWATRTGAGVGNDYLKVGPAIGKTAIFTASANGTITSVNKENGTINWQVKTRLPITTSPGLGDELIVVGSRYGDILALQQTDGKERWKTQITGEILATPAVSESTIVVKSVDGIVRALSAEDGTRRWLFQQTEPNLILHGSSAPLIRNHNVIVGFANGNLTKLSLRDGQVLWQRAMAIPEGAFAIERMIDIDVDPIVFEPEQKSPPSIYVATYQGNIAALDWSVGNTLWKHSISSYTGMSVDDKTVYISDAKSAVLAFDRESGVENWRQTELLYRIVSGPATMGNYIVVGDAEGYLHWLDKVDGHFVAREKVGSAIYAAPVVADDVLYVLTNTGYLVAYTLNS